MSISKKYLGVLCVGALAGLCALTLWATEKVNGSIFRHECIQLYLVYDRWVTEGRPQGEPLFKFISELPGYELSQRSIVANGAEFVTCFKRSKPAPYYEGDLYIATNGVVVWLRPAEIVTNFQTIEKVRR